MPEQDEEAGKERFLIGCLVLVAVLGGIGLCMWTPIPGLLVMRGG